jgi:hypothetical protein
VTQFFLTSAAEFPAHGRHLKEQWADAVIDMLKEAEKLAAKGT